MQRNSQTKNKTTQSKSQSKKSQKSHKRAITTKKSTKPLTRRSTKKSALTTTTTPHRNFFLSGLFGASRDQRVVYEPLNSFNPITLRSTVVPVAYKFPAYILPSIDIISIASRQTVTPNYADTCYIIDKTPKLLQLPSISAVTNDSKFVQVFAEATICVSNSNRFSLIGDNYVQVLQSLVETSVANVVSYIAEKDVLDKQYESFLVTNIHQDLQRLCDDVGVDVLKLVVLPSQLDLTNVAAQLQLLQTMNSLSLAINNDNNSDSSSSPHHHHHQSNPLTDLAENSQVVNHDLFHEDDQNSNTPGGLTLNQKQAADLMALVTAMMKHTATQQVGINEEIVKAAQNDPLGEIEDIEQDAPAVQQKQEQQEEQPVVEEITPQNTQTQHHSSDNVEAKDATTADPIEQIVEEVKKEKSAYSSTTDSFKKSDKAEKN